MRRELIINLLFSILIMVAGVTQVLAGTISAPMVEFPAVFHFLTLAGDVIEVGPGVFQVEAAE
ncbi:MAG TPA: hypothetical protein PKZ24_07205 [Nitrospirales bacterium]|nr:hypothetical protein [Nitrospirales bacterium]